MTETPAGTIPALLARGTAAAPAILAPQRAPLDRAGLRDWPSARSRC